METEVDSNLRHYLVKGKEIAFGYPNILDRCTHLCVTPCAANVLREVVTDKQLQDQDLHLSISRIQGDTVFFSLVEAKFIGDVQDNRKLILTFLDNACLHLLVCAKLAANTEISQTLEEKVI